jgi:hypothetical protein
MPGGGVGVASDLRAIKRIREAPALVPAAVTLQAYRPNRLVLNTIADQAGWLLVTDRWSPGWRGTVDGEPTTVFGGNLIFRAVRLHAGSNTITFEYQPAGLSLLVGVSWGLLAIALGSAGVRWLFKQDGPLRIDEPLSSTVLARSPELSIVIPCFDSEGHIAHTIATLRHHVQRRGWEAEIVLVDDGSRDRTAAVITGCMAMTATPGLTPSDAIATGPRLRLIRHARNAGKGRAVRTGILAARGRSRVFTDSDLPYSLQDLTAVVTALGQVDIAVGGRPAGRKRGRAESRRRGPAEPGRGLASWVFSQLASRWFRLPAADPQCGLKGFTAEAANRVFGPSRINGFSFDVEALWIARELGLRVQVLPVTLRRRADSSVHIVRHSVQMLVELILIRLNALLGRYR